MRPTVLPRITLLVLAIGLAGGCDTLDDDASAGPHGDRTGDGDGGGDGAAAPAPPVLLYASPSGRGTECVMAAPCSLVGARDRVRQLVGGMQSDVIVNLLEGTYVLDEPFVLSPAEDSGRNGHVIGYQAAGYGTPMAAKVVLSGGKRVTGFSVHDEARNVYRASVGDLTTRQLFVDGKRARRARRNAGIPGAVTETATGYVTTSAEPLAWAGSGQMDVIFHDGDRTGNWLWAEPRCPVASVKPSGGGAEITIASPCFPMAHAGRAGLTLPSYVEHFMAALKEPGTFYLDTSKQGEHVLFYIPRPGEDLTKANVIAGSLETLVKGDGKLDAPIANLAFKGITFADSTWLGPDAPGGFNETSYNKFSSPSGPESQIHSAVWFYASRNVRFEGDTFRRLGGAALAFDNGSQGNEVVGCEFTDVAGNGVQIGNVDLSAAEGPALVTDNVVANSYFHDIGVEYPGAYGVWNANTQNTTVTHNVFAHLPRGGFASNYRYSGGPSVASGHKFTFNHVYDYMNGVRDGGGFDTNGMQNGVDGIHPNTVLMGNVFHGDHERYGQIYLDFWSSGITVENNIAYDSVTNQYNTIPVADGPCCNRLLRNFYDKEVSYKYVFGTDMMEGDTVLGVDAMPASILQRAGLEPAYRHLLAEEPRTGDTSAPTAPASPTLVGTASGPRAMLAWQPSKDDVGVTGYEIDDGDRVLAAVGGGALGATATGLRPGTTYELVVRARDKAGNLSAPSAKVTVTIPGDPHLVGHWTFDDPTFADASGSQNGGTGAGVSTVGGRRGNAAAFNGASSTIDVGSAVIDNLERSDFTIAVWFKASGPGFRRMVTKGNFGDTPGYLLNYNGGGITFGIGSHGVKDHAAIVNTPAIYGDDAWHHVAAVAERKNMTLTVYVDGAPVPLTSGFCGKAMGTKVSIQGCPYLAASSNDPLTIGSYRGAAELFSGALDDLRIYDRALTPGEILDLTK